MIYLFSQTLPAILSISSTQKIPQAKQDIYNFSNQIVVDITNLAVVFGETGGGQLTQKAWEDLQETR